MKWLKKGQILGPENLRGWMNSHAQCPTVVVFEDRIRIFFSSRLENQQSLPTYIDVDINDFTKIINFNENPILNKGRRGTFDENGIIPSCFVKKESDLFFYYAGWSQSKNVPYKNFTGLAISKDNGLNFKKFSESPVFTMDRFNPLSATGPCIILKENIYYAIYSTGIDWVEINGKIEHTYLLTYATSLDCIVWECSGKIIIHPEKEYVAHCKPAIIKIDETYHMWFSKRGSQNFRSGGGDSYRLGYATSKDLINWDRKDNEAGIDVSNTGWDSEMICYPDVFPVNNKVYMIYNGNGFGKSGFGFAELEK